MDRLDTEIAETPVSVAEAADQAKSAAPSRKVFVKTYGCQMNVYDSERMSDALTRDGYTATDSPEDADLVLINTCHIREKAAEKVYSQLGRLNKLKKRRQREGSDFMVAVAGCVAQAEGQEITRRGPVVDVVPAAGRANLTETLGHRHVSRSGTLAVASRCTACRVVSRVART